MSARTLRFLLNIYPPFLGAGIRVAHLSPDFRSLTMRLPLRFYNRNYFGTQFGGSMFSMANPGYVLMLANILGGEYVVWDRAASIQYITPGRSTVYAHFDLSEAQIAEVRERTAGGEKFEPVYPVRIVDDAQTVIAAIEQTLYIRKKPS